MPDIQRRFAEITMKLFAKHGIRVVGFWETVIGQSDELVYICAFDDLAHRQRAWSAFLGDPEWQAAKKSTEANGPIVERVVNKIWTDVLCRAITAVSGDSSRRTRCVLIACALQSAGDVQARFACARQRRTTQLCANRYVSGVRSCDPGRVPPATRCRVGSSG